MGSKVHLTKCSRFSTVPPLPVSTTRPPSSTPRPAPCTSSRLTHTTRRTTPPPTTTGSVPAPTGITSTTAPRFLADGGRVNDHINPQNQKKKKKKKKKKVPALIPLL